MSENEKCFIPKLENAHGLSGVPLLRRILVVGNKAFSSLSFLLSPDSEFLKNQAFRFNIIKQSPQDKMVRKSGLSVDHAYSLLPRVLRSCPYPRPKWILHALIPVIAGLSFLPSSPQEWSAQKRQEWATTLPYPTTKCRRSLSYLPRSRLPDGKI